EDEKEKAYSAIRKLLYSYYDWELRKREAFLHDISVAENYISTANEKGRKPENIEKRKKALLKYQEKLKIVDESVSFYGLLIDFLVNHKVKVLFIQHNNKSRYYSGVRFECILLFYEKEKIDGYFGSNGFTHKIPEKYRNYLD
ncbi:MAG: hypothetical protein IJ583_00710, partial [Firmicutes bacterium]|nr:hypothetical protein [Bacillota bacterium]